MLKIQEYILANGIEKAINNFKLKTRVYENKILLKYDQLIAINHGVTRSTRMSWINP